VPNKILLLALNQKIWPPETNLGWLRYWLWRINAHRFN